MFAELADRLEKIHIRILSCNVPNESIYHYTTVSGLIGILQSEEIWFSDYKKLNDPQEISFARAYLFNILNKLECEFAKSFVPILKNFIEDSLFAEGLFHYHICSFCKRADYLPAWRYYADNGLGFAIGFSSAFLKLATDLDKNHPVITQVLYDDIKTCKRQNTFNLCKNLLQGIFLEAENFMKENNLSKHDAKAMQNIGSLLSSHILAILPMIKHIDYESEEECRLYIAEPKDKQGNNYLKFSENMLKSDEPRQAKKRRLESIHPKLNFTYDEIKIDYIKYKLEPGDIDKIYIGPANKGNFEKSRWEIEQLIPEKLKPIEIVLSKIQYQP